MMQKEPAVDHLVVQQRCHCAYVVTKLSEEHLKASHPRNGKNKTWRRLENLEYAENEKLHLRTLGDQVI